MDIPRAAINILMCVLFASIFLIIFFFTYVNKIEEKVIINNVNYIIDSVLDGILPFIPPQNKKAIFDYINSLDLKIDKAVDIAFINSNNKLLQKSVYGITALAIVIITIIAVIYLLNKDKLNPLLPQIATENLIIVCFIGLTEFVFLNEFASKFISANSNFVKSNLLHFNKIH